MISSIPINTAHIQLPSTSIHTNIHTYMYVYIYTPGGVVKRVYSSKPGRASSSEIPQSSSESSFGFGTAFAFVFIGCALFDEATLLSLLVLKGDPASESSKLPETSPKLSSIGASAGKLLKRAAAGAA